MEKKAGNKKKKQRIGHEIPGQNTREFLFYNLPDFYLQPILFVL